MTKMYKIVGLQGEPLHGGSGKWHPPDPQSGRPGKWMPKLQQPIVACRVGYHLVPAVGIRSWLKCPALLFEAEGCGAADKDGEKIAYQQARLLRLVGQITDAKLTTWAADCAERVLPLFEAYSPTDDRPRKAIAAARAGAAGAAAEAARAAWAAEAAWAAAGAARAAWAARAAARAAWAAEAAWAAAGAARVARAARAAEAAEAARAAEAAWAAAGAAGAAWAAEAAEKKEIKWQAQQLLKIIAS